MAKKIEPILALASPKTVTQLHSFISMIYLYHDMWCQCSHILAPLKSLTMISNNKFGQHCNTACDCALPKARPWYVMRYYWLIGLSWCKLPYNIETKAARCCHLPSWQVNYFLQLQADCCSNSIAHHDHQGIFVNPGDPYELLFSPLGLPPLYPYGPQELDLL
jgi:hypothetical protein